MKFLCHQGHGLPSTTNCPPIFHKTTSLALTSQASGLVTLWTALFGSVSVCQGRHSIAYVDGEEPGRNLNDRLSCALNITAVAQSYRFAFYNICTIRSFLTKDAVKLLVQELVISCLDYCNCILAGLPASATKPLHQNAAAPHFQSTQILPCDPPPP